MLVCELIPISVTLFLTSNLAAGAGGLPGTLIPTRLPLSKMILFCIWLVVLHHFVTKLATSVEQAVTLPRELKSRYCISPLLPSSHTRNFVKPVFWVTVRIPAVPFTSSVFTGSALVVLGPIRHKPVGPIRAFSDPCVLK